MTKYKISVILVLWKVHMGLNDILYVCDGYNKKLCGSCEGGIPHKHSSACDKNICMEIEQTRQCVIYSDLFIENRKYLDKWCDDI